MCSDNFISYSIRSNETFANSANFQFCMNIADWTFQQKSVLRTSNLEHRLDDPVLIQKGQHMHDYKEGDPVHFQIDVEELKDGKWVPFEADDI